MYLSYCGFRGGGKEKGEGFWKGLGGGSADAVEEQVDSAFGCVWACEGHGQLIMTGVGALRDPILCLYIQCTFSL